MCETLIAIAKLLIGAAIAIVIIVVTLALPGEDEKALWTITLVFFLMVALIWTIHWSTNLLVPPRKSMPSNSKNRATAILGVPYVLGFLLILISGWEPLAEASIPWGTIVQTAGAALMAAALGLGVTIANQADRRIVLFALVAMEVILVFLVTLAGWKAELIALGGVIFGVVITEWVLSWALQRWCR